MDVEIKSNLDLILKLDGNVFLMKNSIGVDGSLLKQKLDGWQFIANIWQTLILDFKRCLESGFVIGQSISRVEKFDVDDYWLGWIIDRRSIDGFNENEIWIRLGYFGAKE